MAKYVIQDVKLHKEKVVFNFRIHWSSCPKGSGFTYQLTAKAKFLLWFTQVKVHGTFLLRGEDTIWLLVDLLFNSVSSQSSCCTVHVKSHFLSALVQFGNCRLLLPMSLHCIFSKCSLVQLLIRIVVGVLKNTFDHLCIDGALVPFGTREQTDLREKKSLLKFPKALPNVLVYHLASGCLSLAEIQS